MKKFNQVISVEVEVDTIADLLLSNMNPECKHSELVVESIVGRLLENNSIGYLYNSLNGYSSDINFQVGDNIASDEGISVWGYFTPESIENNSSVRGKIKEAVVVAVNKYADLKLKVEYKIPQKTGESKKESEWVSHKYWNKVNILA